jgi:uncharacterized membrane protein YgdD (TMEM256/DUF423 family)
MALGSLAGLIAVGMAAAAAHALPQRLDPASMQMVRSGIQMQGWHALALLACGLWAARGGALTQAAGAAFTLGTILFCGSVYLLALKGIRLGPTAPAGGMLLMLGWLLLGLSALRA